MNLASDRFYQGSFNYRAAGGGVETAPLYSYESGSTLYDVLLLDGRKYYRSNMGQWFVTLGGIKRVHSDIERHFNI